MVYYLWSIKYEGERRPVRGTLTVIHKNIFDVMLSSLGIRITMKNGRCIGGAGVGAKRPEKTQVRALVGDNEGLDRIRGSVSR